MTKFENFWIVVVAGCCDYILHSRLITYLSTSLVINRIHLIVNKH